MSYCVDKLKMGWILTLKLNLTLKVKVNHPQNNKDLNQGLLHLWSKFGDPSLNGCWVIAQTNLVTDGLTDRRTQATTIPVGQYWPRVMKNEIMNSNQGDHVTFVWSWNRSKQRLSFCHTFHPFIQHHDADDVHRRTLWVKWCKCTFLYMQENKHNRFFNGLAL